MVEAFDDRVRANHVGIIVGADDGRLPISRFGHVGGAELLFQDGFLADGRVGALRPSGDWILLDVLVEDDPHDGRNAGHLPSRLHQVASQRASGAVEHTASF